MNSRDLLALLTTQIPISKFMEVSITEISEHEIKLLCPLKPNHNHLGGAFGGSLSTMMIFAAYCQLYYLINGKGHVLIKSSQTEFIYPVEEDIQAIGFAPSDELKKNFLHTFERKGKGKIQIESVIKLKDGRTACRMKAEMVAMN